MEVPFPKGSCVSAAQEQQELSNAPQHLQHLHSWRGQLRVPSPALPELLVHTGAFPVHPAVPKGSSAGTRIHGNPLERLCCSPKEPPELWQLLLQDTHRARVKWMGKYEENWLNLQQWTDSLYERYFFPGNKSCSYRIPFFYLFKNF